MLSNVRYGSLASGVREAAGTIVERANTIASVWVGEYELLKLPRSGCLVLLYNVRYDAVALTKQFLVLGRECLTSFCHSQGLRIRGVG